MSVEDEPYRLRAGMDVETAYLGRGWSFPVRWPRAGSEPAAERPVQVELVSGTADVREAIPLILETMLGERVMRPTFGSELQRFVFAPLTVETCANLARTVRGALLEWELRIHEVEVEVEPHPTEPGRLDVRIDYAIDVHRMRQSLVYPFYTRPERW
jgi:phage baseplate assembly protein W